MPISRRHFVQRSTLAAAAATTTPHVGRAADAGPGPGQKPRHIIMLVSDGMSAGTLTAADHLSHLVRGRGTAWMGLYNHPAAVTGLMDMRSLDSLVTDSSAASSSWGSGSRIANGAVNMLPDGRELTPLYTLFQQAGWKRGLVTTTEITHATPAGFAANDGSRGNAEAIAGQYLARRVEVLLGGGRKFYDPKKRKDQADLWEAHRQAGYHVARDKAALEKAPLDKPWLGTFSDSHLPYSVDQTASAELQKSVPTLGEMTRAALRKLEREEHFILQVEGGRVDHGAHTCDAAATFYDQIAFDEAIDVCLEFQKRHPDTLLVITTDHGNGNPGLNGIGKNYMASSPLFANLKEFRGSFDTILAAMGKSPSVADIQRVLREFTGYQAAETKCRALLETMEKKGQVMFESLNSVTGQLGQMLANHTGVGWISGAHTADYVCLAAVGPGAERFRGFSKNTDVFHHFLSFAGIVFRNPELPLMSGPLPGATESSVDFHWREGGAVA
jgi:alkaline phosphatase